jgi:erythritol transport system permease protein
MNINPLKRGESKGTAAKFDRRAFIVEIRALVALAIIVIFFSVLSDKFLQYSNLVLMTRHVAMNAILAIGMLLVILNGGIDLSVGSIVGLSGVVAGYLMQGAPVPLTGHVAYPNIWAVLVISLIEE